MSDVALLLLRVTMPSKHCLLHIFALATRSSGKKVCSLPYLMSLFFGNHIVVSSVQERTISNFVLVLK